jgi:multidrug resistance protein, MATE family
MRASASDNPHDHPFVRAPHAALLALSAPVLFSLIAEPLTGLVDTIFVARLGAEALAALGVGTAVLSSAFWIFNFLGIGTQTQVAQALGRGAPARAARVTGLALLLSGLFGLLLVALGWPLAGAAARALGADGAVQAQAVAYIRWRLLGGPAVLALLTAFGALRGMQDMRTPLWAAAGLNGLNIALDALLIPGWGALPALGVVGAAVASALAQWVGAAWAVTAVVRRLGWPRQLRWGEARALLHVGGDLFLRTGMLTLFLLLTTRVATRSGADSGAAHQAIRQVWTFTALGLDALAITAQSLVGYFMGAQWVAQARRVAAVSSVWGVGFGVVLGLGMWLGEGVAARLLVPATAVAVFSSAWGWATAVQPLNALAFVTDGIHWGTGDFRYLRNAVFVATLAGGAGLALIDVTAPRALAWVWAVMGVWILLRALLGIARIWPGIGQSPFAPAADDVSLGRR